MQEFLKIDRQVYELAKNYLYNLHIEGVNAFLIEKYLNPFTINPRPDSKQGIYRRMLESGQNANMKARVIGGAINGVENLSIVLENFEPNSIIAKYGDNWEIVLDDIIKYLHPRGTIPRKPRSIWPNYCRTILSSANFIRQFSSADDFYKWVDFFDRDDRARASLPMLLSSEIEGFGFSLSCDFLKELGYINFPKPDVHLRDIFTALKLCPAKSNDYKLFKSIIRVASHSNVSPYNADKVFWLIGSGYFYDDPHIGRNGKIGSHKQEFIIYASKKLYN